jgi:uncharacterized membrane protein YfcA
MTRILLIVISLAALIFVLYLIFSKNQKPWNEMTEEEQRSRKKLVAGGIAIFLAGLITAFFTGKKK